MMKQENIFRKIGSILTELNEQYQFLAQNPEQLNELEVELFLANAHFLSDHVQIIKKLNIENPTVQENIKNDLVLPVEENIELKEEAVVVETEEVSEEKELEGIVQAEEAEERVDLKPEQEIVDEEKIHEETAERVLEYDFFKPDQDVNTFEFDLSSTIDAENDKFEFEEKPVEQIFDRKLSKEEEEILARKKSILENKAGPEIVEEPANLLTVEEDDEIGPEPFLISKEAEETTVFDTKKDEVEQQLVVADYNPKYDDPIISPPVIEDRPAFIPETVPVKPIAQPIADKPAPSLNDLLAKTNGHLESFKSPISDLKQGINLNEKLLFIKDLFNGYNLAYSEAIDLVNKMTSFEVADTFLQKNYAVKNNWASKQATVDQFYELLNRRFSS